MHRFMISAACALILGVPVAHADRIDNLTWALAALNIAAMECPIDVPDTYVANIIVELLNDDDGYKNLERSWEIGAMIVNNIGNDRAVKNEFCMQIAKAVKAFGR